MTQTGRGWRTPCGPSRDSRDSATLRCPCPHPSSSGVATDHVVAASPWPPRFDATRRFSTARGRRQRTAATARFCVASRCSAGSPRWHLAWTRGAQRGRGRGTHASRGDGDPVALGPATPCAWRRPPPAWRPRRSGAPSAPSRRCPSSCPGAARATAAPGARATAYTAAPSSWPTRPASPGAACSSTPRATSYPSPPSSGSWVRCRAQRRKCPPPLPPASRKPTRPQWADAMAATKMNVLHWHMTDDQRCGGGRVALRCCAL